MPLKNIPIVATFFTSLLLPATLIGAEKLILPIEIVEANAKAATFDLIVLGNEAIQRPLIGEAPVLVPNAIEGKAGFRVEQHQVGIRIDEAAFLTPATSLAWSWQKDQGKVCIVQVELVNPTTLQRRYFGYAAGTLSEAPAADPTVEVFVADRLPSAWTQIERNLFNDCKTVLGWDQARIASVYLSPWDGQTGLFAGLTVRQVTASPPAEHNLKQLSQIGRGKYLPQRLRDYSAKHIERFDSSFEEGAPGRNSGANEWSAFGVIGDRDFNCMGRELYVRYPAYDLAFRLIDANKEIMPDSLSSFRLGLVNNRLPALWGGWMHDGLLYKVSVMTVPDERNGNFDLYKLEIQNPTDQPLASKLAATLEGPPDMRVEDDVARGLGDVPFLVTGGAASNSLSRRDWGLCDKRAKAYATGGGPGATEPAVATYRLGLDGVPVVYRFKAQAGKQYVVVLVSTPHISGYLLEHPKQPGDLVFEYEAEGTPSQRLDYRDFMQKKSQPLCAVFNGAQDTDGDGYIEVRSGVAPNSRIRHTRLSVLYVFPDGTQVDDFAAVYSGSMNDRCVWHIDVGVTPEQAPQNQYYDKSDVGFARQTLHYSQTIQPHAIKTYWIKVPAIHRREPVSMGYIAHAFRTVLPGEGVPPFPAGRVADLRAVDPTAAEERVVEFWNRFFTKAAQFDVPDPILNDLYLSRLATRAILDVQIAEGVVYNACSPFFYFDHAYRDQSYVIYANDLAGLHERAARVLRAYCMDVQDIKKQGPISFDGKPLQLGMLESGLWLTRPGQYDTLGQNLWALVEHYKLSGDREWLEQIAYPYIKRGAMWIVNSRHQHMQEVGQPDDPRYGLIEPGGMEVLEVGKGMHMYYMNAFAILGLREAADAARALGSAADEKLFTNEAAQLKRSLHQSFEKTFKRTGLYEGHLWFGVEPEGVGMYGFWAHNCLLWPCRALDPHDPMLTATYRRMERMSADWGGGMFSEGQGGYWPYIGVDRAVSYILRDEPDKALDYFCAYVDVAGGTLSWGEGYGNVIAGGDQPHFWADAQYVNLFRHLFVTEDGSTLLLTPATPRRWHQGTQPIRVTRLPTQFGDLDLVIQPQPDGRRLDYTFKLVPRGDQANRPLDRIVVHARAPRGRRVSEVRINGQLVHDFVGERVPIARPERNRDYRVGFVLAAD